MPGGTQIEWTATRNPDGSVKSKGKTWNPVTGCHHVSDGCRNCYAEVLSLRFGWSVKPWTAINAKENVVLHPERLEVPLRWKKPSMIFVNSMSDLFHELVPDEYIEQVFSVMAQADQHTFQILTKRPKRMMEWCHARYPRFQGRAPGWDGTILLSHLSNVWLGTSVENQRAADERLPYLRNTPAAVRFLSCEPLLEEVDLKFYEHPIEDPGIDWVICGGESGLHYRPFNLNWARSLRDQCQEAGVAYFFKQVGGRTPKAGGRMLDGREWNEMPGQKEMSRDTLESMGINDEYCWSYGEPGHTGGWDCSHPECKTLASEEARKEFLEDTVDDAEYNAYLDHLCTPSASEY